MECPSCGKTGHERREGVSPGEVGSLCDNTGAMQVSIAISRARWPIGRRWRRFKPSLGRHGGSESLKATSRAAIPN